MIELFLPITAAACIIGVIVFLAFDKQPRGRYQKPVEIYDHKNEIHKPDHPIVKMIGKTLVVNGNGRVKSEAKGKCLSVSFGQDWTSKERSEWGCNIEFSYNQLSYRAEHMKGRKHCLWIPARQCAVLLKSKKK